MKRTLMVLIALALVYAIGVQGNIPGDADGDGVPDSVDVCPAEDASLFDRDGDGCLDDPRGGRHVEYWGITDATVTYVIDTYRCAQHLRRQRLCRHRRRHERVAQHRGR